MTVDEVRRWLDRAGYDTDLRRDDPGVVRAYRDGMPRRLVGMVVVRQDAAGGLVITYAELAGQTFPFWPTSPYETELERLQDWIRKHPNV